MTSREFAPVAFSTRFEVGSLLLERGDQVTIPVIFENFGASGSFVIGVASAVLNLNPETIKLVNAGELVERELALDTSGVSDLPAVYAIRPPCLAPMTPRGLSARAPPSP